MFQNKNFNTPGGNSVGAQMGKITKNFIDTNKKMEVNNDDFKLNNNMMNNNLNSNGNNSAGNNNFLNPNNMKRG